MSENKLENGSNFKKKKNWKRDDELNKQQYNRTHTHTEKKIYEYIYIFEVHILLMW